MKLQLNRVAHPVTVLGPGRRLGLWVQGCHIRCAGCASVDTWDPAGGRPVDTEELAEDLASTIVENRLTGLTITGGVITSAGLVLAATFAALSVIPILFLVQIAFIVSFGVLLDTFVVRSLLVPALSYDIGRAIWWPSRTLGGSRLR